MWMGIFIIAVAKLLSQKKTNEQRRSETQNLSKLPLSANLGLIGDRVSNMEIEGYKFPPICGSAR